MRRITLELAAAQKALGLLQVEHLSEAATNALVEGCDSPSLRTLAGLQPSEYDEAPGLLDRVIVELKLSVPTVREAVYRLAREAARSIIAREVGPYEGAKVIWELRTVAAPNEAFPEFDVFVYDASVWEDQESRPEVRAALEKDIRAAARRLIGGQLSPPPSSPAGGEPETRPR